MKTLRLGIFFTLFAASTAFGQAKPVKKVIISTPTIQCDMCKGKIEKALKNEDGINSVVVNVKKKTTTVVYVTDRINEEQIKTDLANAGFDAGNVSAEPAAYKKLPACCKKPAPVQASN